MRIAVDARPLAHPQTGIGRYTESLLRRLVTSGHQWFLYSDREISPRFAFDDHVQVRQGRARPGSPQSLIYSQLVFPRWARGDCVDVFWSPRHHLPLQLPRGIARVVTVHDLVWKRFPQTMRRFNWLLERVLMAPSLQRADSIIAVSEFTRGEIAALYPDVALRCAVVHEAAEPERTHFENTIPLPREPYFLFVGTLEPRKNLMRLLQAFALALPQLSDSYKLLIAGAGGWGDVDLPAELQRLGIERNVALLGRVSEYELQALYSAAYALVMPSLYEGFGLPALEAMSHGKPVIASNCGALPEVVGDAGILVDPHSTQAISSAIQALATEQSLMVKLALKAKQRAAIFCWDRAAADTLKILEFSRVTRAQGRSHD